MPTICPNCLRPVRSEARFCGFCGSNLYPDALDEVAVAIPAEQTAVVTQEEIIPAPPPKRGAEKIRRNILIAIVILLCLVLLVTFLIHYLPIIGPYLGALISVVLGR
jgi:hypothetical protein